MKSTIRVRIIAVAEISPKEPYKIISFYKSLKLLCQLLADKFFGKLFFINTVDPVLTIKLLEV